MKNILIVLSLLMMLCACQKEKMNDVADVEEISVAESNLYEDIMHLEDPEDQKLAYSQLPDSARCAVWLKKIASELGNPKHSEAQRVLIKELLSHITPQVFSLSDEREIFHNGKLPSWLKKTDGIFTSTEVYFLVYTLESYNDGINRLMVEEPPATACHCAVGSAYTCGRWNGSWPPGIDFGTCSRSSECVEERNCGALWDLNCDGNSCSWS